MLNQRRRRWAGVVHMLYNCIVFAGIHPRCTALQSQTTVTEYLKRRQSLHISFARQHVALAASFKPNKPRECIQYFLADA